MSAALLALFLSVSRAGEVPASVRPDFENLAADARAQITAWEIRLGASLTGRRLLIESRSVQRLASIPGLPGSAAVKYLSGAHPKLAFDPARFASYSKDELDLQFARELAKASMAVPIELAETEMAAGQTELVFALDKAEADPAFAKRLAAMVRHELRNVEIAEGSPGALYPPQTPNGELERAARQLALFHRAPDLFYWAVQRDLDSPRAVRLADLEDFYGRFGPAFSGARESPGTPWVRMGGRRYPAALLTACRELVALGGPARIHEALADFEAGPAQVLGERLRKLLSRRS